MGIAKIGGEEQKLALITRFHNGRIGKMQAPFPVGTRYLSRGTDETGNASNSAETEQIVINGNVVCSFVQVRGTIPLFWKQEVNSSVKPPIDLVDAADSRQVSPSLPTDLASNWPLTNTFSAWRIIMGAWCTRSAC